MRRLNKPPHTHGYGYTSPRQRGSVYIMVLGASLLVALIGVSSLMAARVQRRATTITAERIQARELARAGIDRVMYGVSVDPLGGFWRPMLANGDYESKAFAGGTFSVTGVDPNDGNLTNGSSDPVVLTSTGVYGQATYILEVTVSSGGNVNGPNLLINPGFESGLDNWNSWSCDLVISGSGHSGSQSLLQTNRLINQSDGSQSVTDTIQNGTSYYVEVWAKTVSGTETLKIDLRTIGSLSGGQNFQTESVVVGTTWTKISGVVTPKWSGTLSSAMWRVFSWPDGGAGAFYTDDAVMAETGQTAGAIQVVPGSWKRVVN